MLLRAASLASSPRCFGCKRAGTWLCATCSAELPPPRSRAPIEAVDAVTSVWAYEGTARDLILRLKLASMRPAAAALAEALAGHIQRYGTEAGVLTWVPGRRRDVRIRGFDHAELIARELGGRIGLPVVRLLARTTDRPDQTTLSGPARRINLEGAFVARPGGRRVMVIDDLVTTGATARTCGLALKAAGSDYVEVATPCRV